MPFKEIIFTYHLKLSMELEADFFPVQNSKQGAFGVVFSIKHKEKGLCIQQVLISNNQIFQYNA